MKALGILDVPMKEDRAAAYFGRMTRKQIGEALAQAREAKGLTFRAAVELAAGKGVKITTQQIQDIEQAKRNYTIDTAIGYAKVMGMKLVMEPDVRPAGKGK